ncbi:MAG TPA: translesion error-prone DNA polymerase V autoproteolytic subunit [Pyrinomonadaceae bacterium]|jgi:DNA polymerase V|nr:translesion error-prone DNA polymerase V autoproteolytic subunit [Pyrinomonadaceae bacterium]
MCYKNNLQKVECQNGNDWVKNEIGGVYRISQAFKLARPLFSTRVSAGFPSPAEDYIEGRIDLNRELIRHPLATFYVRVIGDSMEPRIYAGELLIVDRMMETKDDSIVVARLGSELCVKRLRFGDNGDVWLISENPDYKPIHVTEEMEFEVWGRVLHSIKSH